MAAPCACRCRWSAHRPALTAGEWPARGNGNTLALTAAEFLRHVAGPGAQADSFQCLFSAPTPFEKPKLDNRRAMSMFSSAV
ncbi:MAG: hypothetical protein U0694_26270 [Anaerolineae bacterium]